MKTTKRYQDQREMSLRRMQSAKLRDQSLGGSNFWGQAYTDGSRPPILNNSLGFGGWGAVFLLPQRGDYLEISGGETGVTVNRMELMGIYQAMLWWGDKYGDQSLRILSDSQYCVGTLSQWMWMWKADPEFVWEDRENGALLSQIMDLILEFPGIFSFEWVRGHAGNQWNEYADALATSAMRKERMRRIIREVERSLP